MYNQNAVIEIWRIKDKNLRSALYAANRCKRTPVTAKWLLENPDADGYLYDAESEKLGMGPWIALTGVGALKDESRIILEFGRTGEMEVHPWFIVFVPMPCAPFDAIVEDKENES